LPFFFGRRGLLQLQCPVIYCKLAESKIISQIIATFIKGAFLAKGRTCMKC
jgi:hypothetical protein